MKTENKNDGSTDLVVVRESERFYIPKKTVFLVGRLDECDIYFPDNTVSNQHAEIGRNENGLFVVDRGSSNGTFVNGRRITPEDGCVHLNQGDRIGISRFVLLIDRFGCDESDYYDSVTGLMTSVKLLSKLGEIFHDVKKMSSATAVIIDLKRLREANSRKNGRRLVDNWLRLFSAGLKSIDYKMQKPFCQKVVAQKQLDDSVDKNVFVARLSGTKFVLISKTKIRLSSEYILSEMQSLNSRLFEQIEDLPIKMRIRNISSSEWSNSLPEFMFSLDEAPKRKTGSDYEVTNPNIDQLSDLSRDLPFPVAHCVSNLTNEAPVIGPLSEFDWITQSLEQIFRLVVVTKTALVAGDSNVNRTVTFNSLVDRCYPGGRSSNLLSMGSWIEMAFAEEQEIQKSEFRTIKKTLDSLAGELSKLKNRIFKSVERRNKRSHDTVSNGVLSKWNADNKALLVEMLLSMWKAFDGNTPLQILRVKSVYQYDDHNMYKCKVLHGNQQNFNLETIHTKPETRLVTNGLFLVSKEDLSFLRLDPLVMFRPCAHCGINRYYTIDAYVVNNIMRASCCVSSCDRIKEKLD